VSVSSCSEEGRLSRSQSRNVVRKGKGKEERQTTNWGGIPGVFLNVSILPHHAMPVFGVAGSANIKTFFQSIATAIRRAADVPEP